MKNLTLACFLVICLAFVGTAMADLVLHLSFDEVMAIQQKIE